MQTEEEGSASSGREFADLSSDEILWGILAFLPRHTFSEQRLLAMLHELQHDRPEEFARFEIKHLPTGYRSAVVRRIIDFLEIGKLVEVAQPNPVEQYYRVRPAQMERRRKALARFGVLPAHEERFRKLAEALIASPVREAIDSDPVR